MLHVIINYKWIDFERWRSSKRRLGFMSSKDWVKEFLVGFESKFDIGGSVDAFSFFVLKEEVSYFDGVSVLVEAIGALEVEPEDLDRGLGTCSTLHFIWGTSSLTDFSWRQVRKLFSRKLHSVLNRSRATFPARGASIAYPWLLTVIINIKALIMSPAVDTTKEAVMPFLREKDSWFPAGFLLGW